jgi:hypothetical protein
MKTKRRMRSFPMNHNGPAQLAPSQPGPCQPPRKSVTHRAESVMRLMYSDIE